jgi:hypothetical protein
MVHLSRRAATRHRPGASLSYLIAPLQVRALTLAVTDDFCGFMELRRLFGGAVLASLPSSFQARRPCWEGCLLCVCDGL